MAADRDGGRAGRADRRRAALVEVLVMTKPCKECDGVGKILRWLGEPTEPCEKCQGTGTIEVVEEPLTPWQQQIESRVAYLEEWLKHQEPLGDPEVTAQCQKIIKDFIMKERP